MSATVLLVTKSNDNHSVTLVAEALEARGARAFRLDTDLFPTDVQLALHQPRGHAAARPAGYLPSIDPRDPAAALPAGYAPPPSTLRTPAGELVLDDITAVWYRRAAVGAALPADLEPQHRDAALKESRATLFGMLENLDCFTMNRYSAVRSAEHKPRQLELAAALGLDVPRTLTTNDPDAARAFWTTCHGRVVGKMLSSFSIYDEAGREQVMFTSILAEDDLAHLDQLALSPMTFQEHLDKAIELRVTLIGGRIFAAAVDSQALERARTDWRKEGVQLLHAWKPYDLPATISAQLLRLADRLELSYGAVDIIVTPSGRHVFLEINPGGEWFWLDDVFGPRALSTAIAETLLDGRAARP